MARKKCKECLSCFQIFWVNGRRYYHCWLCNTFWEGRNDSLQECADPRQYINIPVEIKEQEDESKEEPKP
jgi:hypothetical protein